MEKDNTLSFGGYLKISGSLFLLPQVIAQHDFDIIILHQESNHVNRIILSKNQDIKSFVKCINKKY